jgi:hypothetical protein
VLLSASGRQSGRLFLHHICIFTVAGTLSKDRLQHCWQPCRCHSFVANLEILIVSGI